MTTPLLSLSGITKSFGAIRALKGVSFDLLSGEVHALVGENGAGKTTLIKVITGAHQPDSGTIHIDGALIARLQPASAHSFGIAAIYQQPALFPDLSVMENIAMPLEKPSPGRLVRWNERRNQAVELLRRVGADIAPETEVCQLSMPQQQLVEIARALGAGARILLMDEPTASLTNREVDLLFTLIKDLRSKGVAIIYISHRLLEIFQIADRVTVLRDGETVGTRSMRTQGLQNQLNKQNPDATFEKNPGHHTLTQPELIQMMVGREVSALFPPAQNKPGEKMFSVKNLSCRATGTRDVSFDLSAGEILGISGLVGAGRTELAHVLFGITPADSGTIQLKGRQLQIHSPRDAVEAGIAYVPEDRRRHGVILEMPIAANVTMAILSRLFPATWMRSRSERELAQNFIQDLGIKAPSSETRAGALSGGNQQKVSLARWLAASPNLLILDEPTQGIDVGAKAEIHKLIRQLAAKGMAVLMISSELPEILGMSDRVAVMRGGTIIAVFDRDKADAHCIMAAALGK
jgi:rhamnose transport system ATP-binding protein